MNVIKKYIIKKYLKKESNYLKLERFPKVGRKLISNKWFEHYPESKKFIVDYINVEYDVKKNDGVGSDGIMYYDKNGCIIFGYSLVYKSFCISANLYIGFLKSIKNDPYDGGDYVCCYCVKNVIEDTFKINVGDVNQFFMG